MTGGGKLAAKTSLGGRKPFSLRQAVSLCGEDSRIRGGGYCVSPLLKDAKQRDRLCLSRPSLLLQGKERAQPHCLGGGIILELLSVAHPIISQI